MVPAHLHEVDRPLSRHSGSLPHFLLELPWLGPTPSPPNHLFLRRGTVGFAELPLWIASSQVSHRRVVRLQSCCLYSFNLDPHTLALGRARLICTNPCRPPTCWVTLGLTVHSPPQRPAIFAALPTPPFQPASRANHTQPNLSPPGSRRLALPRAT